MRAFQRSTTACLGGLAVLFCVSDLSEANSIRVQWEGEATLWYSNSDPSAGQPIRFPVEGLFELDLAAIGATPFSRASWDGSTSSYFPLWQIDAGAGAPTDFDSAGPFGDFCNDFCTFSGLDPVFGLVFNSGDYPFGTLLQVGADGTGDWAIGDFYHQYGASFEGIVSSSRITLMPEPSAALVFGIGILVARRARRTNRA